MRRCRFRLDLNDRRVSFEAEINAESVASESLWLFEVHPIMSDKHVSEKRFPLRFTLAQRKLIAEIFSEFSDRMRLDEPNERLVSFSLDEMRAIQQGSSLAIERIDSGMKTPSKTFRALVEFPPRNGSISSRSRSRT
jgi:hypothetical protein